MDAAHWALAVTVLALGMYVLLDGPDLGVGLILPLMTGDEQKQQAMRAVSFAWDGNESWLILAGVSLWGSFPRAYAALLPALYLPVIFMIFALIVRGASIELQDQGEAYNRRWGRTFGLGSWVMAITQGLVLGNVLNGVPMQGGHFVGGPLAFLNPVGLAGALLAVCGYGALGGAWLYHKTDGALAGVSAVLGRVFVGMTLLAAVVLARLLWERGLLVRDVAGKGPVLALLLTVSALGLIAALPALRSARDAVGWTLVSVATLAALLAAATLLYPFLVPPTLTLTNAASPPGSIAFLLTGVVVTMPFVLAYNLYAARFFRGKVTGPVPEGAPASGGSA